jgi:hypothetical protein
MKLVDLLEILTRNSTGLTQTQRADARILISELRKINAFGNAINSIDVKHECVPRWNPPEQYQPSGPNGPTVRTAGYYDCRICGRNLNNV